MEEAFQGVAKRDECEWDWRRTRFQQWRQQIAALCHSSWELVPLYLSFYLFLHSFVFFCGLRWDYRLVLTKTLILLLLSFFCYLFIFYFSKSKHVKRKIFSLHWYCTLPFANMTNNNLFTDFAKNLSCLLVIWDLTLYLLKVSSIRVLKSTSVKSNYKL